MINLLYTVTFSNIINLLLGVIFSFTVLSIIMIAIFKSKFKRNKTNRKINEISEKTYDKYFTNDSDNKITKALIYQASEVSKSINPFSKNPLYELSINQILDGINLISDKLKSIVSSPLSKDLKNVHIATLINLKSIYDNKIKKIFKSKVTKILYYVYRVIFQIINIINPIFYFRKISNKILIKKGKKDITLITLDYFGNLVNEIYKPAKKRYNNK